MSSGRGRHDRQEWLTYLREKPQPLTIPQLQSQLEFAKEEIRRLRKQVVMCQTEHDRLINARVDALRRQGRIA